MMNCSILNSVAQSSLYSISHSSKLSLPNGKHPLFLLRSTSNFATSQPRLSSICFFNAGDKNKEKGSDLAILKRWDVPWDWPTASLTSLACGISFVLTGLAETAAIPLLGIHIEELSLDDKAQLLLLDQSFTTAVVLGVIYGITNTFRPLPQDMFRYDVREPFDIQKGWIVWAVIGLVVAILGVALTGFAMSTFNGDPPQRETDSLVRLLPLIGSSSISTACLLGITGVLAPILEETLFRGFFMTSLTKWVPTPISVVISAAVFAIAHLTPGEFPQLFVLGLTLGFSYAQTRNLLTPITVHAFWNSGVIIVLTLLQLQGYDIKELLQAT
ncbi:CAAX amino terminal protease family protein [Euphorbia peplus]|nr:CAAX amino terminal protease family protein [Euphorbia peplus]